MGFCEKCLCKTIRGHYLCLYPHLAIYLSLYRELNYNDLVEIDDKYESKQAISLIEKHYEPGMSAPATLVIQQKESLASTDYLRALDELTGIIANTPV